jgi:GTP-binding protein Era
MSYLTDVCLIGAVNVGKSTIFNRLLTYKYSATSGKPHTTKQITRGLYKYGKQHVISYLDTPGYDSKIYKKILETDIILLVTTPYKWSEIDQEWLQVCIKSKKPTVIIINKVDNKYINPEISNFFYENINSIQLVKDIIAISAKHGHNISLIQKKIKQLIQQFKLFKKNDSFIDFNQLKNEKIYECIREKLFRMYHHEIPHTTYADFIITQDNKLLIDLFVNSLSKKNILMGKNEHAINKFIYEVQKDLQQYNFKNINVKVSVKKTNN